MAKVIQILKMGGSTLPVSGLNPIYILVNEGDACTRYRFDNYRDARSCLFAIKHGKQIKIRFKKTILIYK